MSLIARFRAVADLEFEGSEDDDGVLLGGAEDPRRYPFGGGEWGLPGCQGAGFVNPWSVYEQRQRRVSLSPWMQARSESRRCSV